jgi:hypothetical protein
MKKTGVAGSSRKAGTPTGQHLSLGMDTTFPDSARSLTFFSASLVHGCRIGLLKSATRNIGFGLSRSL